MGTDTLDERELAAKLAERERWFATTLNSIGDAVVATDADERIRFMNPVAEELTAWTFEEARGRSIVEVLRIVHETSGAPVEVPLVRALREGCTKSLPRNSALVLRNGDQRGIEDSAAPIIDDKGRVVGGVMCFRDVTERRALEKRFTLTERLAAIGTLSAGMAHEINNPLAYVLANVEYALDALSSGGTELHTNDLSEVVQALREAKDGSHRVHRIVHDLKKFGRAEEVAHTVLSLTDVLDRAIRMTDNVIRHHARVRCDYRAHPLVQGDEGQLGQVFINLLLNAAHALGEGAVDAKEIVVSTWTDNAGRAVAEVRDNGAGIPAALVGRIFDPFFTTKAIGEGTGIGLSICHSIVLAHGGEITVESEVGSGTTFAVALSVARAPVPRVSSIPASTRKESTTRGRVLVIDDEPAVGRAIARILQREHEVRVLTDARVALAQIRAGAKFDVVFCDVMMPNFTGVDFFTAVAEVDPLLARRVVFVTGGVFTARTEEFLRSTVNATVAKPMDPLALRRIVADYVARDPSQ